MQIGTEMKDFQQMNSATLTFNPWPLKSITIHKLQAKSGSL